jgi:hypothetical protein
MLWLTFFVIVRCERSDLYMKAITIKTSEKPLALDMGRKAAATTVALKYF